MPDVYKFEELGSAPLICDALYRGGNQGNLSDDPISKLLRVGNQGGFRQFGSAADGGIKYVVLYSNLNDKDWPDAFNEDAGTFTYYGDNKKAGNQLHETPKKGNKLLSEVFRSLHSNNRNLIPPFFVFTKGDLGRDVVFKGLAVPGAGSLSESEDLVAIWRTSTQGRFQNYKAVFTMLDCDEVSKKWLTDLEEGKAISPNTPSAFYAFITSGIYNPW